MPNKLRTTGYQKSEEKKHFLQASSCYHVLCLFTLLKKEENKLYKGGDSHNCTKHLTERVAEGKIIMCIQKHQAGKHCWSSLGSLGPDPASLPVHFSHTRRRTERGHVDRVALRSLTGHVAMSPAICGAPGLVVFNSNHASCSICERRRQQV